MAFHFFVLCNETTFPLLTLQLDIFIFKRLSFENRNVSYSEHRVTEIVSKRQKMMIFRYVTERKRRTT